MKNFSLLFFMSVFLFAGCSEKESLNEMELMKEDIIYSEIVRVFDENQVHFVDVEFSSVDKSVLTTGLDSHDLQLILNTSDEAVSNLNTSCNEEESSDFEDVYEDDLGFNDLAELSIEVVSQSFQDGTDYTLSFISNDSGLLKSIPPSNHYIKYKAKKKRKYVGVKYFPVESDNNGIYFHWTRTNCWVCKWRSSEWVWVQGHVHFEWEMAHPDSNKGYYRLGVGLYTNSGSNFQIKESDSPIVW